MEEMDKMNIEEVETNDEENDHDETNEWDDRRNEGDYTDQKTAGRDGGSG